MASKKELARNLVQEFGQLYSDGLGISLEKGTPSPLFRWLCAANLYSARISQNLASRAARRLADEGWTTAEKMARTTWEQRVRALNESGYARYDERTARMFGDMSEFLLEEYGGDLRELREKADRDPQRERQLLKDIKGIGDVGVNIFFREVQVAWNELVPFADKLALQAARKLDLPSEPEGLARLVDKKRFAKLVAALVRVELGKLHGEALETAAAR